MCINYVINSIINLDNNVIHTGLDCIHMPYMGHFTCVHSEKNKKAQFYIHKSITSHRLKDTAFKKNPSTVSYKPVSYKLKVYIYNELTNFVCCFILTTHLFQLSYITFKRVTNIA